MPPRLRRWAYQFWVFLLAVSLAAAGGVYLAAQVIDFSPRIRWIGYAAFPVLLILGLASQWATRRFFPIVRRLHGVTSAKANILLGRISVSSGRLVIGQADFPLMGITLEHVPNGTFAVLGEVTNPQRDATIVAFHIAFSPRPRSDDWQKLNLSVAGKIMGVFDPTGREYVKRRDLRRARRAFSQQIEREIDPRRPFFLTHRDAGGRPWAVTFEAPHGPGAYRLHVRRLRGEVIRIDCRLDDSSQIWRPAAKPDPDEASKIPQGR